MPTATNDMSLRRLKFLHHLWTPDLISHSVHSLAVQKKIPTTNTHQPMTTYSHGSVGIVLAIQVVELGRIYQLSTPWNTSTCCMSWSRARTWKAFSASSVNMYVRAVRSSGNEMEAEMWCPQKQLPRRLIICHVVWVEKCSHSFTSMSVQLQWRWWPLSYIEQAADDVVLGSSPRLSVLEVVSTHVSA